ncbi:hypothetical protein GN316_09410 [Xylophilus sp. Kf1]|nr:hypothetical protein [Xylophilus sp. Kf1]
MTFPTDGWLRSPMIESPHTSRFQQRMSQAACVCLVASYTLFPVLMAPGFVATALTLVFWLLAGHFRERLRIVRDQPVAWIAVLLFVVVLLWCLHPSADPTYVGITLRKYSKLLLVPLFISLLAGEAWRRRCMDGFVLAMLFILFSVYAGVWVAVPWSVSKETGWGVTHMVVGDYITQGIMMCFLAVVTLDRAKAAGVGWRGAGWMVLTVMAALSVTHLSKGRTGYVMLLVGVVAYLFTSMGGRRRWAAMLVALVAVGAILLSSAAIRERVELGVAEAQGSGSMQINSIGGRVTFWKTTLGMIAERPVTGWGTGSYHEQFCRHIEREDWCEFGNWHPHNQFLFFWMENGLPGVLFYAALVLSPLWAARRATPRMRGMLVSFSCIFLIDSMVNAAMWSARENHFFAFMLALVMAQAGFASRDAANRAQVGGAPSN